MLGRVADVQGYPASYVVSAGIYALSIPFMWLAKRGDAPGDYVGAEASRGVATPDGALAIRSTSKPTPTPTVEEREGKTENQAARQSHNRNDRGHRRSDASRRRAARLATA